MKEIILSGGATALVDDADHEALSHHRWHVAHGYAARAGAGRSKAKIYMHREILAVEAGLVVDHANGDQLDNRRANLRPASASQNGANRGSVPATASRFKGVYSGRGKWRAIITIGGRQSYQGSFATEEEAARAYDRAAVASFGEHARLNFQSGETNEQQLAARRAALRDVAGALPGRSQAVASLEDRTAAHRAAVRPSAARSVNPGA